MWNWPVEIIAEDGSLPHSGSGVYLISLCHQYSDQSSGLRRKFLELLLIPLRGEIEAGPEGIRESERHEETKSLGIY